MFFGDPAVQALIKSHDEFEKPCVCLWDLLLGDSPDTETWVTVAMISAGVYGSTTEPHLSDIPDADLHRILLDRAQLLLRATPSLSRERS